MTTPSLLELAKQGHPQAIARLFNSALQPGGISASVNLDQACLQVTLSADRPIDQARAVTLITQAMQKLHPPSIHTLEIAGVCSGQVLPHWQQTLALTPPSTTPAEARPTPILNPPEAAPAPATTPPLLPSELAELVANLTSVPEPDFAPVVAEMSPEAIPASPPADTPLESALPLPLPVEEIAASTPAPESFPESFMDLELELPPIAPPEAESVPPLPAPTVVTLPDLQPLPTPVAPEVLPLELGAETPLPSWNEIASARKSDWVGLHPTPATTAAPARTGNLPEIATLIRQWLEPTAQVARINRKADRLQVMLTVESSAAWTRAIARLQTGIQGLALPGLNRLQVFGQLSQEDLPEWSQEISLQTAPMAETVPPARIEVRQTSRPFSRAQVKRISSTWRNKIAGLTSLLIGLGFCATGVGAVLGIPLITGGLSLLQDLEHLEGPCPHCQSNVTVTAETPSHFPCPTCGRAIQVEGQKFYAAL